jgi:hypothetical protein
MDIFVIALAILLALGALVGFTVTYFNIEDDSFDKKFYETIKNNSKNRW